MSFQDDVRKAVATAVDAALARIKTELVDGVTAAVPEPPAPPPAPAPVAAAAEAGSGADVVALRRHLFALLDGSGQVEILNQLMEDITRHWDRSILFLVKGTQFQPWDARGFEGTIGNDAAKQLVVASTADTILATALSGEGRQSENGLLDAKLGPPRGTRAAVPLGIRNKPAAVLYAEGPKLPDDAAVACLELVARITASAIELGMLTKRTPPFVRTDAAVSRAGAAGAQAAAAAPVMEAEIEIEAEPADDGFALVTPAEPAPAAAPAWSAPAAAPPAMAPPAPAVAAPAPAMAAPAPAMASPPPAMASPAPPAATFTPTPAAMPAPAAPAPPRAAPAPPAPAPAAPAAAAEPAEGGTLDPRELLKGGAKPVVDAGQSMQPSKSYSRWKPVRDQVKTGEDIDPAMAAIPESERARHVEARKIARLLVSEIKLYNEAKVAVGRKNRDLYERLKEDIERSRQTYLEKVGADLATSTNYFRDELVATLAEGDAEALGAGR